MSDENDVTPDPELDTEDGIGLDQDEDALLPDENPS